MAQRSEKRSPPGLSYLFDCRLEIGDPEVEEVATGSRRSVALVGGRVAGPALDGTITGGEATSTTLTPEEPTLTNTAMRFTVTTDAGEVVSCECEGVLDMPEDARERLESGGNLPVDEIYFRVTARFRSDAPSLAWLNRVAAVGVGSLFSRGSDLEIYQLL